MFTGGTAAVVLLLATVPLIFDTGVVQNLTDLLIIGYEVVPATEGKT